MTADHYKLMTLEKDCIIHWQGFGFPVSSVGHQSRWPSSCRLRIYDNKDQVCVLFTDISESVSDVGTSITNSAENLIELVTTKFSLKGKETIFIEEYPGSNVRFSLIERNQEGKPEWYFIDSKVVASMLGGIPNHKGVEGLPHVALQ